MRDAMNDSDGVLPASPRDSSDAASLPCSPSTAHVEPRREMVVAKDDGSSLDERLSAVTNGGGFDGLPPEFGDVAGDWTTVRSDNPFTVLCLDWRSAARIPPELVERHRDLLQRF